MVVGKKGRGNRLQKSSDMALIVFDRQNRNQGQKVDVDGVCGIVFTHESGDAPQNRKHGVGRFVLDKPLQERRAVAVVTDHGTECVLPAIGAVNCQLHSFVVDKGTQPELCAKFEHAEIGFFGVAAFNNGKPGFLGFLQTFTAYKCLRNAVPVGDWIRHVSSFFPLRFVDNILFKCLDDFVERVFGFLGGSCCAGGEFVGFGVNGFVEHILEK